MRRSREKEFEMLVVSRKLGESVRVGDNVNITVVEIKGSKIRLGVVAEKETTILRGEIADESVQERKERAKRAA